MFPFGSTIVFNCITQPIGSLGVVTYTCGQTSPASVGAFSTSDTCIVCPAGTFLASQDTCTPSDCLALSWAVLGDNQIVVGGSCYADGVQDQSHCILGCAEGYVASDSSMGLCQADQGLSSASYQWQDVTCASLL